MVKSLRITTLFVVSLVMASYMATGPVHADPDQKAFIKSVIGSWDVISDQGNAALSTFGIGKTVVVTIPDGSFSTGHGSWKRTGGPRTFTAIFVGFVLDGAGQPAFKTTVTEVIQVSQNGASYTSAFETEIRTLDGTLVSTVSGTNTATRITVD